MVSETKIVSPEPPPQDLLDNPEVNQAAFTFRKSMLEINSITGNMGTQGLRRVFRAVAEYPLAPKNVKFKEDSDEAELFDLTLAALAAKHTMLDAVMQHQMQSGALLQQAEQTFKEAEGGQVASQENQQTSILS